MKRSAWPLISIIIFFSLLTSCEKEEIKPEPVADFTMSKTSAEVGDTITFTNISLNASRYSWDFGDGKTSTNDSPSHAYSSEGTFNVTLTASGDGGENIASKSITVYYPKPVADFTMSKTSAEVGDPIFFTNTSLNASNYFWDFGDGKTSANKNPIHSYSTAGTFTITLKATGKGGENSLSRTIVVKQGFNIIPGASAMGISLAETWASAKSKLSSNYTQYGPLLLSGSSGSYVIHPVESKSQGITLYFLSVTGSLTFNSSDVVFLIVLNESFVGQTEKGIKMGSTLSEVKSAYGNPDRHDTVYSKYEYKIGISFYYNSMSKIDEMGILTPQKSNGSDNFLELLMKEIHR